MKEIFMALQELFTRSGWHGFAGILSLIVTFFGAFQVLWSLLRKVWNSARQRALLRDLHPFYTPEDIQRATQYYVETKCQNVAPSKAEEPRRGYAFAARENTISFFLKKAFKQDGAQFYIILADSGMGKTTFLINLYLRYLHQFFAPKYQMKLFPLGWPNIDQEIESIAKDEQKNTILLFRCV